MYGHSYRHVCRHVYRHVHVKALNVVLSYWHRLMTVLELESFQVSNVRSECSIGMFHRPLSFERFQEVFERWPKEVDNEITYEELQVYPHVNTHVYMHVNTHVYTHVNTHVYMHVNTHVYKHVNTHVYTHVYTYVYKHVNTHVYACVCTHIRIHITIGES